MQGRALAHGMSSTLAVFVRFGPENLITVIGNIAANYSVPLEN